MGQTSTPATEPERVVKEVRRATRRRFSAEEKIRIVLAGLRGEDSIAELAAARGSSRTSITDGRRSSSRRAKSGSPAIPRERRVALARAIQGAPCPPTGSSGRLHDLLRDLTEVFPHTAGNYTEISA